MSDRSRSRWCFLVTMPKQRTARLLNLTLRNSLDNQAGSFPAFELAAIETMPRRNGSRFSGERRTPSSSFPTHRPIAAVVPSPVHNCLARPRRTQSDGARNRPSRFAESPPLQDGALVLRPTERDAFARLQGLKSARELSNFGKLIRRMARSGRILCRHGLQSDRGRGSRAQ